MRIKHCEHCARVYQPADKGLMSVLCRRCKEDCDQSYFKLHKVVRHVEQQGLEAMALDMDWLAEKAGIPSLFALLLFKEGYFSNDKNPAHRESSDQCQKCETPLNVGQRRYCDRCSQILSRDLRNKISATEVTGPPTIEPPNRINRYGLGGRSMS